MIIRSIRTVEPSYDEGEEVALFIDVEKQYEDGGFIGSVYDDRTNIRIQDWSDSLKAGSRTVYTVRVKPMPKEDWRLRIVVVDSPPIIWVRELTGTFFEVPPDIETFTVKYEAKEEPPEIPEEEEIPSFEVVDTVSDDTPFWAEWLKPFTNLFSNVVEAVVNWVFPTPVDFNKLFVFLRDPIGTVNAKLGELFSKASGESLITGTNIVKDLSSSTPESIVSARSEADNLTGKSYLPSWEELSKKILVDVPSTPPEASKVAVELSNLALSTMFVKWGSDVIAESLSLGQLEAVGRLNQEFFSFTGMREIASRPFMISLEESVYKKAQQYWTQLYTPELPSVDWLINMVVKEKLTVPEFINVMKFKGLPDNWSQLIWDSHFIAPNLTQLLHSWRLGTITKERLVELQTLVDLDPIFNDIWFDQWYDIPTRRETRYLYELGVIDEEQVRTLVFQSGVHPSYQEGIVDYIIGFQERNWTQRYLVALAMGYRVGAIDEAELRREILNAHYSNGVADWMVKTEDVRRRIAESKTVEPKEKVLPYSVIYDSFMLDKENVDWVRVKLFDLGYEPESIDTITDVWENEKYNKEVGVKTGGLSVSQILTAMYKKALTNSGRNMTGDESESELELILDGEKSRAKELLELKGLTSEFADVLITSRLR